MLTGLALCCRDPKQDIIRRENGKPTYHITASLQVTSKGPSVRMAKDRKTVR